MFYPNDLEANCKIFLPYGIVCQSLLLWPLVSEVSGINIGGNGCWDVQIRKACMAMWEIKSIASMLVILL